MPGFADVIFSGGAIYTADTTGQRLGPATAPDGKPAGAVAVADGVIVAVGATDEAAITDRKGPRTQVVDLRGRALVPGFQDAHVHPAFAGVTMVRCNLIGCATFEEAVGRIEAYAAAHPEKEWIAGSGWRMEWFDRGTPSRHQLDKLTGGRPAFLTNRDGHGAWASTRALELAGFGKDTPDPADGRFEREADGSLQGTLHEGAADLVGAHVPKPAFDERLSGLLLAQRHLHERGIT
ncbi:MAG TPA: amidohydrolase family protein, partial [Streptosporangiaceae bacterium]